LRPNFSHRLTEKNNPDTYDLTDTISLMSGRAIAVLNLLHWNIEGGSTLNDEYLISAIDCVVQEVSDIAAYAKAFHEMQNARQ
jgi:hypothetical protein